MVQYLDSQKADILYPESDGKPLADNTKQFRLIVTIQGGLDSLFLDNANVFVAGDLFWYPVEGEPRIKQAPDVMVVMGRPKGDRRSYKQWQEDNIAPQVVFEISSKGNTIDELENSKRLFYQCYGVEEYYIHDPDRGTLKGWLRSQEQLEFIERMSSWVSPRLEIRFELVEGKLQLYKPNGEAFSTYVETVQQREQECLRAENAEQEVQQQRQRANSAEQRANSAEQSLEKEKQRMQALLDQLKARGIDPDELGLS